MRITLKTIVPSTIIGMLSLSACCDKSNNIRDPKDIAKEYMQYKPVKEYQKITASNNPAYIQSKLDSLAFNDLFLSTRYSHDSSKVTEFNKIASSMRKYPASETNEDSIKQSIIKALQNENISLQEYEEITENYKQKRSWLLQHEADSWKYNKFFKQFKALRCNRGFQFQIYSKKEVIKP